jgi:uncharacterized protein involved in type VI secretion and phage assembly
VVVGQVRSNVDPFGLGRVQVYLPHLSDENLSPWVRVSAPFAGRDAGAFFLPNVGDEVLVAFEQGDVNRPLVVGSFWGGLSSPPEANRGGLNLVRMIRTPTGHMLKFDDAPGTGAVTVESAAGARVVLEGDGSVRVEAAKSIALAAKSGVTLDAGAGDVAIKAANVNVTVTGKMNVQ